LRRSGAIVINLCWRAKNEGNAVAVVDVKRALVEISVHGCVLSVVGYFLFVKCQPYEDGRFAFMARTWPFSELKGLGFVVDNMKRVCRLELHTKKAAGCAAKYNREI